MLDLLLHIIRNTLWRMPLVLLFSAIASYLLGFVVRAASHRLGLLDEPKRRSSHSVPVPRTGGVAIIFGGLIGVFLVTVPTWAFLLAAGIGAFVAAVSFLDDLVSIPPLPRLGVHLAVAGLTIWKIDLIPHDLGLPFLEMDWPRWLGLVIATLFVVAFVNFYNFMDGINGLAASQGVWGGVTISLLLLYGHSGNSIFAAAALAGACLGFLPHNFPVGKMFMGDVGATTLGFGLGMLTLIGGARSEVPWMAFLLPVSLFIYDPAFSVIKRLCQGANPLKPHREFHFHLLIRCGWSHERVTRFQFVLMAITGVAGLAYAWAPRILLWTPQEVSLIRLGVVSAVVVLLAGYSVWVHWYFARHRKDVPEGTPEREAEDEPVGALEASNG